MKPRLMFIEFDCDAAVTSIVESSFVGSDGSAVRKCTGVIEQDNGTIMPFEAYGRVLEGAKVGDRFIFKLGVTARSYQWQGDTKYKIECRVLRAQLADGDVPF
jgi:hypothetical protein